MLVLAGCAAVGADYTPPDEPISSLWHTPLKGGLNAGPMDQEELSQWWRTLNDPLLSRLI